MVICRYFISDTGAIQTHYKSEAEAKVRTASILRTLPSYRQCTLEEYQAKRRWQARQERKEAAARCGQEVRS